MSTPDSPARDGSLPAHIRVISGGTPASSKQKIATENILSLDYAMFEYYDRALGLYKKNLLAQHPVIMALFSNEGGNVILHRPGAEPITAPQVPMVYQILKSIGHCAMAVWEICAPYVDNPDAYEWVAMAQKSVTQQSAALATLGDIDIDLTWRAEIETVLRANIAFKNATLAAGRVTYDSLHAFTMEQGPRLANLVRWAAHVQVEHWMGVIAEWKASLGADWERTYGLSNSIYVARQNNILFSVLAQFFGPETMNRRLLLFETTDFTTTPADMLTALTRVVADRSVGMEFFGNYYLMDYELMGGDARDAIIATTQRMGLTAFLPPLVTFGTTGWPMQVTPGTGPATIAQVLQQLH